MLGVDADIATMDFRSGPLRSLSDVDTSAYHLPPRFLDRVALHLTKHYLGDAFPGRAPLILAIWGPKGCGKSFQVELACKMLGVRPVVLSAGELEDPTAGEPGKRLRERYASAAKAALVDRTASCLLINDLDAGIGAWKDTGRTVNAQNVAATLMALCDEAPGKRAGSRDQVLPRIPIVVTGNDLSKLYAPLLRDGRMDKFFWQPDREERAAMLLRIFESTGSESSSGELTEEDAFAVVDRFAAQPPDFFGAIAARTWDGAVSAWVAELGGVAGTGAALNAALYKAQQKGLDWSAPPMPPPPRPPATREALMAAGAELEAEQQSVIDINLAKAYMRWGDTPEQAAAAAEARQQRRREAAGATSADAAAAGAAAAAAALEAARAEVEAANAVQEEARQAVLLAAAAATAAVETEEAAYADADGAAADAEPAVRWQLCSPEDAKAAVDAGAARLVDLRSARDFARTTVKGALSAPAYTQKGASLAPVFAPVADYPKALAAKLKATKPALKAGDVVVLIGPGPAEGGAPAARAAMEALADELEAAGGDAARSPLGRRFLVLEGGYQGWAKKFTPTGVPRQKGNWGDGAGGGLSFWTASN